MQRPLSLVLRVLTGRDQTPGQERVITSPLILGLVSALVLLGLLSVSLWGIIARRTADNLYLSAVDLMKDGDNLNAIERFDRFIAENPEDRRAGKARVLRALARVRQYTSGAAPAWKEGIDAAREMRASVGELPEFEDSRMDLAELVLQSAEGLADRASRTADAESLALAESARSLHEQIAGPAAEAMRERARLPAKLAKARAAVRKGQTRAASLAAMDKAIAAEQPMPVFAERDRLVTEYPDLADDRAVVDRLLQANELLRKAVTFDATRQAAEATPRPEPLGPPTSLVLRASLPAPVLVPTGEGPAVFALADGFAYGLDGADGSPLWHIPVGLSAPFRPQPVAGAAPSALVFDARHEELLRVDARSGSLLWRQSLGEPIHDPPLVLGPRVLQPTASGKLLVLDLASGERTGILNLGMPLTGSPVADEAGQHLYLVARQASLFVLRSDPLSCVAVEYLGHDAGSIPCTPARIGRYLVVPINNGLETGHWRVFVLEQDGASLRPAQRISVPGWTWDTPASQGSVLWATSDRGSVTAYAIGPEDAKTPFQEIARLPADERPSGPAFALARRERELWLSWSRSSRFDLDIERADIEPAWLLLGAGPALAPIQTSGDLAVLTQQEIDGRGVALWGVRPEDGSVAWRTVLGSPWPSGLTASADSDRLETLEPDGTPLSLSASQLASGGFIQRQLPGPGQFRLPTRPLVRLAADDLRVVIPEDGARSVLVGEGTGPLRQVELPAPLGVPPLLWNRALLVPTASGPVHLIDPTTGTSRADPFVPPFDRTRPTDWLAPALIDDEAVVLVDRSGRMRRLVVRGDPRPALVADGSYQDLGSPPLAPPVANGAVLVVATADGRVRALSSRDLSPLGAWPLEAPRRSVRWRRGESCSPPTGWATSWRSVPRGAGSGRSGWWTVPRSARRPFSTAPRGSSTARGTSSRIPWRAVKRSTASRSPPCRRPPLGSSVRSWSFPSPPARSAPWPEHLPRARGQRQRPRRSSHEELPHKSPKSLENGSDFELSGQRQIPRGFRRGNRPPENPNRLENGSLRGLRRLVCLGRERGAEQQQREPAPDAPFRRDHADRRHDL